MSYTPNTWQTGDTITAAKLNNMEQGIASAGGMVVPTFSLNEQQNVSCDLSFETINSAVKAGKCFYAFLDENVFTLSEYYDDSTIAFARFGLSGMVIKENLAVDSDGITYSFEQYPE